MLGFFGKNVGSQFNKRFVQRAARSDLGFNPGSAHTQI